MKLNLCLQILLLSKKFRAFHLAQILSVSSKNILAFGLTSFALGAMFCDFSSFFKKYDFYRNACVSVWSEPVSKMFQSIFEFLFGGLTKMQFARNLTKKLHRFIFAGSIFLQYFHVKFWDVFFSFLFGETLDPLEKKKKTVLTILEDVMLRIKNKTSKTLDTRAVHISLPTYVVYLRPPPSNLKHLNSSENFFEI